jgi:hypothetical protein
LNESTLTGVTQPRRGRTLTIVLIIVAAVLVVCCGGGAAGFYFLLSGTTKAPKAAASDFLDALESGRTEDAYNGLCKATQASFGPEQFDQLVKESPPASHDMNWGGSYSNSNGIETASITASITYRDGAERDHTFPMRKEGNAWKVCGNPY